MPTIVVNSFDDWRTAARRLLRNGVDPSDVVFTTHHDGPSLFDSCDEAERSTPSPAVRIPPKFLDAARFAACHRGRERWELLYRVLWRLTHGERFLMNDPLDDDVARLQRLVRAVSRDAHKAKAFVRFRRVTAGEEEHFVAWHRPDHTILRLVSPFFSRRFPEMHWSILTPDESVTWDREELHYGPGVSAREAPPADELEALWKTYYGSIFNPARIKIRAMKREMPVRHWATLPETAIIEDLLDDAPRRVQEMIERQPALTRPAITIPDGADLPTLAQAARSCTGCELFCRATQTVFGEGPAMAAIVLVGEQPGDEEDLAGRPFVGPAGRLLDEAFAEAGIDRDDVYLTNTVKHFKWIPRGNRRLHKKPHAREIAACLPWLKAELALLKPRVLVCLGTTPTQALIGRHVKLGDVRGTFLPTGWCASTLPTWHPASVLRMPAGRAREQRRDELVAHLRLARVAARG